VVAVSVAIIDSDEHLYEPRSLWVDHIAPYRRADALALVDDELGYTWLAWRGQRLELADVHLPGDVDSCGRHRECRRRGQPPSYRYDDALPDAYWDPAARVSWLDAVGLQGAVCFPNFGLLWERRLSGSLPALTVNMAHPDHDRVWSAFVHHGVSPVFHVADQPRVFDDCWYTDPDSFVATIESVFLWVPAALGLADLIVNGALERHPELRIGVVELSSIWVPQFLLMLDGATEFTRRLNGRPPAALRLRPSEYFVRHVRVSSFAYEDPRRLTTRTSDVFMRCSDYPHSEGTDTLLTDYAAAGCDPGSCPGLFYDNIEFLLGPS
jgi:hypothetical protein